MPYASREKRNEWERHKRRADPEGVRAKKRTYRARTKDRVNKLARERQKERYATDPEYRERVLLKCRERSITHRERVSELGKARRSTPEWKAAERERQILKKYGITAAQWDAIFETQGRACAICSATEPGWHKGWHTDHCHQTGTVRGILCSNCNHGLGKFKDDPQRLIRAAEYLNRGGASRW